MTSTTSGTARRARVRAPSDRPRLAEHRRPAADAGRAARQDRAARLLDLLLRELPARARRACGRWRPSTPTCW
nr:hypothetical protein [Angustibacter aerolatus]